ncbi:collagen alpha-4(VI) chain [Elysia marginata]|uniref:Collagen alpha-4(VI) chain n=1 Tax=Elysia marginata TaxID=1093978 RepID=A0AAV4HUG8_9GAST|nr:collagen alpha-4(VI) chain [Elysia marginata]
MRILHQVRVSTTGSRIDKTRCPQYGAVDRSCVMIPDPQDPSCCTIPNCPLLQPGKVPTPGPVTVTQSPGKLVGIGMAPTPTPMVTPEFYTGTTPIPLTPQPGCMYKGQLYKQSDQWTDGCDWNCECMSDSTGLYSCTSRCPSQYFNNLPPQCVLVQDPDDACCTLPYCDFIHPTPFPNGLPTLVPGKQPVTVTATGTGTQGANEFCVYGGSFFREGETWNDGCDLSCSCDDAKSGFYTCVQRCGDYFGVSKECTYVTDPKDQCCLVPSCTPPINATPSTGTVAVISPAPPLTFTGRGGQPTQPDGPGSTNTGYNNVCVYKGQAYQQDQQFDDGCQYRCTCVDALYGKFRCTERCGRYENLPTSCQLVEDPNDVCCQIPQCASPSPATATPTPPVTPSVTKPTDPLTTQLTTKSQSSSSPPPNACVYDGKYHVQGDVWMDQADCSVVCTCDDAGADRYSCVSRCPVYAELPSFCTLVAGWSRSSSACCRLPRCTIGNEVVTDAVPIGTVTVTGGNSGSSAPTTGEGKKVCQYGSATYQPGAAWFDGCAKTCSCSEDGGYYTCVSRCPDFSTLSPASNCSFVSLPGRCCPAVQCENSVLGRYSPTPEITAVPPKGQTATPIPGSSPAPPRQVWVVPSPKPSLPGGGYPVPSKITDFAGFKDKCVYKNQLYNPGETWQDGCDLTCECLDAVTGYFSCVSKCPQYDASLLPNGCSLVQAGCCMVPECQGPGGTTYDPVKNPIPGMIPVVATKPGVITGVRPSVFPGEGGIVTGATDSCMYKDQAYGEGETWEDGCDYRCQCTSANLGLYTCTSLCPVYQDLPSTCRVKAAVPGGQCCGELQCDPFPTSPSVTNPSPSSPPAGTSLASVSPGLYDPLCHDRLSNCKAYESSSCGGIYQSWARNNCNLTCGYCTPSYTTTPPPCVDLKNCRLYDATTCTTYRNWAETNCRKHCGFCTCEYKNVSYRQGDVWKDGCNLDCQCLNATSGRYICNDICPTYPNLPSGCSLVTKAGECCQQPVCQGVPAAKGCFYKNVAYSEGAQWTDGCDFDCTCVNSNTGDFRCKPIVPWEIPSLDSAVVCRNVPSPGHRLLTMYPDNGTFLVTETAVSLMEANTE